MKLTNLKKIILSLVLLNTLVACKYQVEFDQLDSNGNVITNNLEIVDHAATILDNNYNTNSEELNLKVSTTNFVGELKGDLEMSHCTKSYPATCSAKLNVYSQRIKSDIDFGLPSVMVVADISIDLSNLGEGIGALKITDDSGKTTLVSLEQANQIRRHETVFIKDVEVDYERGLFTITAQHQICGRSGELELDYLSRTFNSSANEAAEIADEPLKTSLPLEILPYAREAQLTYVVKGPQLAIACLFHEGEYITASKTFSFRNAGVGYGQSLLVLDATKKITTIVNTKPVTSNLLPIMNVEVDVRNSTLLVTTSFYIGGKVEMKPCAIADDFDAGISYQSCEADFVSQTAYTRSSIVAPAIKTSRFKLSEVGLGQNNSTLRLNFQGGRATISIDQLGNASVKIDRMQDDVIIF